MQSCSVMKDVKRPYFIPDYSIQLTSVELPASTKERFGETITTDNSNEDFLQQTFEDDHLRISWYVGIDRFHFSLYNKSDHSLKIIWDDAALVMYDNSTSRLMHNGIKYDRRNESQVSTTIPHGAKLEDVLVPTENVTLNNNGWKVNPILPQNLTMEEAKNLKGEKIKVLLPIKIEDVQNEYTFVFNIDVFQKETYITEKVHNVTGEIFLNTFSFGIIPAFIFLIIKAAS